MVAVVQGWGVGMWRERRTITGFWRVEARDAAEHLTMHRTAPHSKGFFGPNLAGAQLEQLSSRGRALPLGRSET